MFKNEATPSFSRRTGQRELACFALNEKLYYYLHIDFLFAFSQRKAARRHQ
jgi:hypothetical protein